MSAGMNPALVAVALADMARAEGKAVAERRMAKSRKGGKPLVQYAAPNALCKRGIDPKRLKRKIQRYRASKKARRRAVWAQEFNLLTKEERVARGLPAKVPVKKPVKA